MECNDRLAGYRGGLGSGKTFILCLWAILRAAKGRKIILCEPSYQMVQDVLTPTLKEVSTLLEVPLKIKQSIPPEASIGKGQILLRSADNPDSLRGVNADDAGLDEASYISSDETYKILIGRLRKSEDGQIRIVGTPRGNDWVAQLFSKDGSIFTQATMDNFFLPQSYINDLLSQYSGDFAKQELYGEIVDGDNWRQFFPTRLILDCMNAFPIENKESLVAGLDVARYGSDNSVLAIRKGKWVKDVITWSKQDIVSLSMRVADVVLDEEITELTVDSNGLGAGAFDILKKEIGNVCNVVEFQGAHRPSDSKYTNKRAESYGRMKNLMEQGMAIPDDEDLMREMQGVEFFLNERGRIQLESKEKLKKRGRHSPDTTDAIAMSCMSDGLTGVLRREKILKNLKRRRKFIG